MNRKIFSALFIALFFSMLGQGIIIPLLPAYAQGLGATGVYIGLVFGSFSLALSLSLPFIGRLSDIWGRKPFILSGLFLYFLTSIAFIFVKNLNAIILIRFLQGIGAAMIVPVVEAYLAEITPHGKEGIAMGLLNAFYCGGLCAGPVIGGAAKDSFGIETAFFIMGIVCLAGYMLCAVLLPPLKKERSKDRPASPLNYRKLLGSRFISGLFLFRFTYAMCLGTVWSFAPLIAETEYNMSGTTIGIMITIGVFIDAAIMVPMGILADKLNKRFLVITGGFITAGAMIFFTGINESWHFYIVSISLGIGDSISMPSIMAMAVVVGRGKNSMGSVMSLLALAESLGMAAGPVLSGSVMDMFGMTATFLGGASVMLIVMLALLFITSGFNALEKKS